MSKTTLGSLLALLGILVGIPLLLMVTEARRTGKPVGAYIKRALLRMGEVPEEGQKIESASVKAPKIDFLEMREIGAPIGEEKPWITHLLLDDLDLNGTMDVVVCDAKANRMAWISQDPAGVFTETWIGDTVAAPAHAAVSDLDQDGDKDVLVASMGAVFPSNDKIGVVLVLENDGKQQFSHRVLIEKVARVTDVRPGDFDKDGDLDLAVAQFGYDDGEIRWMENKGNWQFESHNLLNLSGTIHTPPADMDGDGDLDIVALVSQEWEEIYVFSNDGKAGFKPNMVYGSTNEDFGSSGISLVDMDQDGDLDILYTNGDAFDYIPPAPRPWHGVQWLENKGGLVFEYRRIGDFPGAYFANAVDLDKDGDLDVAVVSSFNKWDDPAAQSLVWFENTGGMEFAMRDLAAVPTHLLVLDAADMDGDGWSDLVSGGMHTYPPYDRLSRVVLWKNRWPEQGGTAKGTP